MSVRGESAMIQELVRSGPIYVSFIMYGDFPTYKSGVYKHISGSYLGGHTSLWSVFCEFTFNLQAPVSSTLR